MPLLKIITANTVILFFAFELAGLSYFFVQYSKFFYFDRLTIYPDVPDAKNDTTEAVNPFEKIQFRIDPNYGYTTRPNRKILVPDSRKNIDAKNCQYMMNVSCDDGATYYVTNNFGFHSVYDYPYQKQSPDEIVVGIFGGSVALGQIKTTMPGLFENILPSSPFFKDKNVTFLSFAREGYKQPQHLQVLAYFLSIGQRFDYVVLMDGVNEILHTIVNDRAGIHYSMPSYGQVSSIIHTINGAIYKNNHHNQEVMSWKWMQDQTQEYVKTIYSAGLSAVFDMVSRYARAKVNKKQTAVAKNEIAFEDQPIFLAKKYGHEASNDIATNNSLESSLILWKRSSKIMGLLSEMHGAKFLHILPPNQYLSGKTFSPTEKKVALEWDKWWGPATRDGHMRLLELGKELKSEGVNFHSALGIYNDITEQVYTDSCCHTNTIGSLRLAEFMVDKMQLVSADTK